MIFPSVSTNASSPRDCESISNDGTEEAALLSISPRVATASPLVSGSRELYEFPATIVTLDTTSQVPPPPQQTSTYNNTKPMLLVNTTITAPDANNSEGSTELVSKRTSYSGSEVKMVHIVLCHNGITRGLDTMWHHAGVETNMGHCLYPEEALFLQQAVS